MTEFPRDVKPIDTVFRPDSLPEMFTPDIATDDERYSIPFSETVSSEAGPLIWLDEGYSFGSASLPGGAGDRSFACNVTRRPTR